MQFFGLHTENIPSVQKASSTSLTLATTNNGTATVIRCGGQAYTLPSTVTLNTGTTSFNGIDTGSLASNTLYYIYAVVQNNVLGLIISVTGPSTGPTGFTSNYRLLGRLRTDFGAANINTVAMDASIVPQGSSAAEWTSFTPTLSWSGANVGTPTAKWRRSDGNHIEIQCVVVLTGSPTEANSQFELTIPNSWTADVTQLISASQRNSVGYGTYFSTGAGYINGFPEVSNVGSGNNKMRFLVVDQVSTAANTWNALSQSANHPKSGLASGDVLQLTARFPVAEWAGLYI